MQSFAFVSWPVQMLLYRLIYLNILTTFLYNNCFSIKSVVVALVATRTIKSNGLQKFEFLKKRLKNGIFKRPNCSQMFSNISSILIQVAVLILNGNRFNLHLDTPKASGDDFLP